MKHIHQVLTTTFIMLASSCSYAQTGPAWAWAAGKITNNGSVAVKSAAGPGTYSAVSNPIGAVAKTNQSAVTQPPTVIIQATSAAAPVQALPRLTMSTTTVPVCPSGYKSVFTATSVDTGTLPVFNIEGTRYGFGYFSVGNENHVGFFMDDLPTSGTGFIHKIGGLSAIYMIWTGANWQYYQWAANLCVK